MNDLTEKFFNEEDIPEGLYYLKLKTGEVVIDEYPEIINDAYGEFERYGFKNSYIDNTEEVLAPVPEYDQWDRCLKLLTLFTKENKKLEQKIDILKEVNKNFENYIGKFRAECENLKENLKLAGKILKNYNYTFPPNDYHKSKDLVEYIEKVLR